MDHNNITFENKTVEPKGELSVDEKLAITEVEMLNAHFAAMNIVWANRLQREEELNGSSDITSPEK